MGSLGEQVLVWTPKGRDAELAVAVLARAGLEAVVCATAEEVCARVGEGSGCAIVTEEVLASDARKVIEHCLSKQPPWSDFPFIVFGAAGISAERMNQAAKYLGNVTIQDRPVKARTLLSAVHGALRARRRQYQGRDAIRDRDQFLAMLGHELRNPLSAIVLATEMLGRVAGDVGKKHRGIIERQSGHLARLVDDLLDVSRITSGKVVLQRAPIDLNELLGRSMGSIEAVASKQSLAVKLRLHVPSVPTFVHGDPVRLEQIFHNLLNNALKYSPGESIITLSARHHGDSVVVMVEDTGVGIAPEMLPRIFDLFTQVPSSIDRSQGGMGIGLTVVKRLVELHDGSVDVESEGLGKGTKFIVKLPTVAAPVAKAERRSDGLTPPLKVVLVEDNEDIRETSREFLEALDCTVFVGHDGPSGLAALVDHRPRLGLVDIGLPLLDGYSVARRARASLGAEVYLVALTGYGQEEDRRLALEAGFDEHLTKPVTPKDLERVLARARSR